MMSVLKSIYSGKRVFVTGHTGFKGTWLIKILNDFGAIIKGYSLAPESQFNLYSEIGGDNLCESVINDLRDRSGIRKALLDFQPDYIFHLAAQPLVRVSFEIPADTFEVNAVGTSNLLDAIRFLKRKCNVVLITTDKVYHNYEWEYPYRENDKLGGYDPYSASKACSELIIESYRNSFFNTAKYNHHKKAIAVGRAGNVIGGGDWSIDRLIPDIAKALNINKEIVIRNPNSIRPWQHVIEPLFGYLELGGKLDVDPIKYSQAYNFGPNVNDALSVKEIVAMSIKYWKAGTYSVDISDNNPHEAGLLKLDISKAIKELNWKPVFSTKKAVEMTINWYINFFNNVPASDLMKKDIQYYLNHK